MHGHHHAGKGSSEMARLTRVPAFLLFLLLVLGTFPARAQVPVSSCVSLGLPCQDVDLGDGARGAYWPGASHIAVIHTHRTADTRFSFLNTEFNERGYQSLGIKSRFPNDRSVDFEFITLDIRAAVRFLRSQPGITRVVLFGSSGGAPPAALYQAVAENGPSFCQMPHKLTKCRDEVTIGWTDSDKADAIVGPRLVY
jgi:hypothetical protein